MWQRCLTAIVGIPLAFFLVYLGGIPFFIAVGILSILGMHEFFKILIPYDIGIMRYYAYFCGIVWQAAVFFQAEFRPLMLLLFLLIGFIIYIVNFKKLKLQDFSLTILGVVYVFGLFNYLNLLRFFAPQGKWWVYFTLILIWSNDTGAFFTGRYLGRHKLHKIVSPKKTIEGALGGIALTTCISFVINLLFRYMSLPEALVLGMLASTLGIVGDLWESALKRIGGVKDSGSLLPGHGGVLDRFDSLLFAAPIIYYFVQGLIFH
ncbi:MAG: phosphatidate cytidylyltransferase [Zhaonellaceae bacterium]|jgi:phosphatidate cytidylyltransferase|nr:phosphatidate cytidylyltransferase [Clostridia bacterium]